MDLKEEEALGDRASEHWYYYSKSRAMQQYVSRAKYSHVMDVGAGLGFFSKYLLEHKVALEATCVDTGYAADREESFAGRPLKFVRSAAGETPDLMLFMDVLEHVPDDVALLRQYVETAPLGCEVFISVPAFRFLWSPHDDYLGHYRRYTAKMLTKAVEAAGLEVVNCSYYFGLVFPLAVAQRLTKRVFAGSQAPTKSDLRLHSEPVNEALKFLCSVERPFVRWNKLAGLSVFCSARKAGDTIHRAPRLPA